MGDKIFVSYSTKDTDLANEIVNYLESNGFPCWIAPRDITSGMDYTDLLNSALTNCHTLLLIVSSHSAKSQWVKKEVTTAVSLNKNIIPFLISPTEIKGGLLFMLNNLQWIDATKKPQNKFHKIVDGLPNKTNTTKPISNNISKQNKNSSRKLWTIITFLFIGVALMATLLLNTLKPHHHKTTPSQAPTD